MGGHLEIITRTERRRKWSAFEQEQILAEAAMPKTTVKSVCDKYEIAPSVIYRRRTERKKKEAAAFFKKLRVMKEWLTLR